MTQSKGDKTRNRILEEALRAASTDGLEGISLGKLAKEIGMSKSGLFAHFASKEDLQLALLEEAKGRFVEVVLAPAIAAPRGEPRLRALFDHWLNWDHSMDLPGGCMFVNAAVELDDRPGPARNALVESQNQWLSSLAKATRIAIAEKHFRQDLDPEQFAYDFYSILLAYHHFGRLLHDPNSESHCRRAFEALLDRSRSA